VNTKEIGEATMQNSVRKMFPLAIAMLLALCGAAIAGDNADVVVSLDSATEVSGVGTGGTIEVALSASGMVGVKQIAVTISISPADAFDDAATTFAPNPAFALALPSQHNTEDRQLFQL
jgi:hypothetical protein